jgi:hypothetical protein
VSERVTRFEANDFTARVDAALEDVQALAKLFPREVGELERLYEHRTIAAAEHSTTRINNVQNAIDQKEAELVRRARESGLGDRLPTRLRFDANGAARAATLQPWEKNLARTRKDSIAAALEDAWSFRPLPVDPIELHRLQSMAAARAEEAAIESALTAAQESQIEQATAGAASAQASHPWEQPLVQSKAAKK